MHWLSLYFPFNFNTIISYIGKFSFLHRSTNLMIKLYRCARMKNTTVGGNKQTKKVGMSEARVPSQQQAFSEFMLSYKPGHLLCKISNFSGIFNGLVPLVIRKQIFLWILVLFYSE